MHDEQFYHLSISTFASIYQLIIVSIRINTRCSSCRSVGRVVGTGPIGPWLRPRVEETAEEDQGVAASIILSAGEFCRQPFTLHF